jgi:hypothetical protein
MLTPAKNIKRNWRLVKSEEFLPSFSVELLLSRNPEQVLTFYCPKHQTKDTRRSSESLNKLSLLKEECDPIISMNKENKQSSIRDHVTLFQTELDAVSK